MHELLYIIPNQYSEDECKKINSKLKNIAEKESLKIINENSLGKKRLSYPIENIYHGYYFLINFATEEKDGLKKLSRAMKLMPEILRHQIVKYERNPDKIKSTKKNSSGNMSKKIIEQEIHKSTDKIKTVDAIEEVKITEPPQSEDKDKDEIKKKINLNDLEKKLDEFIENVDR